MAELTLEAARLVLGDDPEFRWRRDGVEHVKTRTRCRVLSSDSRRAFGLGASLNIAVLDEPGSFRSDIRRAALEGFTGKPR